MFTFAAALLLAAAGASAQGAKVVHEEFAQDLPNIPGKRMTVVTVSYPPGAGSKAHRHDVFVFAYVLEGSVRSQVEGEAVHVYTKGQSWTEAPGSHHVVSENASAKEPAKFIAVLVGDTGAAGSTPDQ